VKGSASISEQGARKMKHLRTDETATLAGLVIEERDLPCLGARGHFCLGEMAPWPVVVQQPGFLSQPWACLLRLAPPWPLALEALPPLNAVPIYVAAAAVQVPEAELTARCCHFRQLYVLNVCANRVDDQRSI
jgi:hypothetical protein